MTSNFIPYLPSSPPPLNDDDDDDDEFGNFTIANYGCNDKGGDHQASTVDELTNNTASGTTSEEQENSKVTEIPNHSDVNNHFNGQHTAASSESESISTSNRIEGPSICNSNQECFNFVKNKVDSVMHNCNCVEKLEPCNEISEEELNRSDNDTDEIVDFHPAEDIPQSTVSTESSIEASTSQQWQSSDQKLITDADKCSTDSFTSVDRVVKNKKIDSDADRLKSRESIEGSDDTSSDNVRLKDEMSCDLQRQSIPEDVSDEFGSFVAIPDLSSNFAASDAVENHIDAGVDQQRISTECSSSFLPPPRHQKYDDANEIDDSYSGFCATFPTSDTDDPERVHFPSEPSSSLSGGKSENHNRWSDDDNRNWKTVHDDATVDEQWDGFITCPQPPTHLAADDDGDFDDEFSDFVCPPSDDGLQTQVAPAAAAAVAASASDSWPVNSSNTVQIANWPSTSTSKANETADNSETFHPPFEAHFSDNDEDNDYDVVQSRTVSLTSSLQLLISSFPPGSTLDVEEICNLESITKDSTEGEKFTVWSCIFDVEKTNSLTYQWSNSSCNKKFLKAINIDSRNLLFGHNWNSSVPLFAANLSLNPLEPTKTPLKSTDFTEDKDLHSPQPQETIPPAQFDWNSSGLTNPLEGLENELLGSDDTVADLSSSQCNTKVSPLLEQILSSAKLSASDFSRTKQSAAHTPEAQIVLNKLPDLSFMQAKVLMFPIRSSSP